MVPKIEDLSIVKAHRQITCLNTVYKIFTGILAKFLNFFVERNLNPSNSNGNSSPVIS